MTRLTRIETVVFLHGVDFFSSCTAEQILRISAIVRQQRLTAGEQLYEAGDPADALYCVVEGAVREGGDGTAHSVGPGETFGAVEILSGRLRTGAALAEQDSLLLAIAADDFFDLLSHNIEIVKAIFRQLLERRLEPAAEAR